MPVPKRKHSRGRTRRKRNAHYKRSVVHTIKCEKCGAYKLPHVECKNCS